MGMNFVVLVSRFQTSSVKCWTANFCIHASEGPVIIMNQLNSIYNSPFKDSHSHPIHTCFPIIASNVKFRGEYKCSKVWSVGKITLPVWNRNGSMEFSLNGTGIQ